VSNLVIVAIPDENDRVWKVSSEEIPHMTLLFLGEADKVANLQQIIEFTEHAANTTLRRFYLPVDRRDELGEDKADVLFFKKGRYDYKAIRDFRVSLLKDDNIRTAYDSSPQHDGVWQPHLTLGYPGTPAKVEDKDLDFGFYDVQFNKIAVWPDDYNGPEFLLKDYWDEYEALETVPVDVAMSDVNQARVALGLDTIEHFGVKGMRWGVRKEDVSGVARAAGSAAKSAGGAVGKAAKATARFAGDVSFENRVADGRAREQVVNAAHKPFLKEDLPGVKARHGDYAKLTQRAKKPFSKEAKAYRKDARETYIKRLESEANKMKNPSGNREYTIRERGIDQPAEGGALPQSKYYWDVSARNVRHAFEDEFTRLELVFDDEGYISDLKQIEIEDAMAQSAELGAEFLVHLGLLSPDDFLEHYGVKGMRWGVRKAGSGVKAVGRVADNALFELGTQSSAVVNGIVNQAHKTMKKEDLPAIKAKHGAAGKKLERIKKPLSSEAKAYRKDVKAAYLQRLEETANTRTNFQGNRRYTLKEDGQPNTKKYFWKLRTEKIEHAEGDADPFAFNVRPIFDDDGWIVDFENMEGELEQSVNLGDTLMSDLMGIEHYGVKGMRWGIRRRGAPTAVATSSTSVVPHGRRRKTKISVEGGENHPAHDDAIKVAEARNKLKRSGTAALSNSELREVANRLQLEAQVTTLTSSRGQKFVMRELETGSQQLVKSGIKSGAKKVTKKKVKKAAATAAVAALL